MASKSKKNPWSSLPLPMQMDHKLTADLLAVCNTLGYTDGKTYYTDPQCLGSAKALVLYLRRDTNEHDIRRLLGEVQVVQRDLIPILKLTDCGEDLSEVVLRLMVNLTSPTLLFFKEELPKDKTVRNHFINITLHLQAYKVAFVDEAFWRVICTKLEKLMEDMDTMLESQKMTVERILILIRNVLQVPADPSEEMRNDDDASVHDQILWVMHKAGVLDVLLYMAASTATTDFGMHILEIISDLFREHTGEQLAQTKLERTEAEKVKDGRDLLLALQTENLAKSQKQVSRSFGGTFVVKGLQAPSGNSLLCHKPVQSVSDLGLDKAKITKRTPKNQRQVVERSSVRRSTLSMRLFLKEFCVEFLNGAYNHLMRIAKDRLTRSSRGQEHDETYYLFALRFFMEFNRYHKFRVGLVSETMNTTTFHYVQGLSANYHELMVTDKDNLSLWSKRAHVALRAYQELLSSLYLMEKTPGSTEASRVIQSTIFYLPEYRELCVGLLASYEGRKLSRNYLCDLIETNHLFLKMLEGFTREKKILVRGKKRGRNGKRKSKKGAGKPSKKLKKNTEQNWSSLEDGLIEFLSTDFELEETIPFDAASDTPIDEQKPNALSRIASHLSSREFNRAVSLLRSSREVWPDDDQLSTEGEISSLKSIFLGASPLPAVDNDDDDGAGVTSDEDENEMDDEEDEEEREHSGSSKETEFDFRGFVERYTNSKIVANYGNLFKHYATLSPLQLHCILKMFHRYVFDLGYPALICQASIFKTFQSILKGAHIRDDLKDVSKFFLHFWPKFIKLAESDPKVFVELFFWKNAREATEIQEGYAAYAPGANVPPTGPRKKKNSRKTLSPEEENEIIVLAEEYASLPEKAVKQVDWINEKLINGPKIKKVISNFLQEKGLVLEKQKKRRTKKGGLLESAGGNSRDSDNSELSDNANQNFGPSDSESDLDLEDMKKRHVMNVIVDSDSDGEQEKPTPATKRRVSKIRSGITDSDDSDGDTVSSAKSRKRLDSNSSSQEKGTEKTPAKSVKPSISDSDSDNEILKASAKNKSKTRSDSNADASDERPVKNRSLAIELDEEMPPITSTKDNKSGSDDAGSKVSKKRSVKSMDKNKKRSRILDSDSDSGNELPLPSGKNKEQSSDSDSEKEFMAKLEQRRAFNNGIKPSTPATGNSGIPSFDDVVARNNKRDSTNNALDSDSDADQNPVARHSTGKARPLFFDSDSDGDVAARETKSRQGGSDSDDGVSVVSNVKKGKTRRVIVQDSDSD